MSDNLETTDNNRETVHRKSEETSLSNETPKEITPSAKTDTSNPLSRVKSTSESSNDRTTSEADRCTSGAGESEYESVDGGDDSKDLDDEPSSENAIDGDETSEVSSTGASVTENNKPVYTPIEAVTTSSTLPIPISVPSRKTPSPVKSPADKISWADATEDQVTFCELRPLRSEQEENERLQKLEKERLEEEQRKQGEEDQLKSKVGEVKVVEESPNRVQKVDDDEQDDDDDDDYEDIESEGSERNPIDDEEEPIDHEDAVSEEEDVTESREDGDGSVDDEESVEEENKKPLDDDEDKRKPQYIPKRGAFYEHDDRLGPEDSNEDNKEESTVLKISSVPSEKVEKKKITTKDSNDSISQSMTKNDEKWGHDMFDENEQKPKSREELLSRYGFDIRSDENALKIPNKLRKPKQNQEKQKYISRSFTQHKPEVTEKAVNDKDIIVNQVSTSGTKATDKIALREAHQEKEKKRYREEQSKDSFGRRDRLSSNKDNPPDNHDRVRSYREDREQRMRPDHHRQQQQRSHLNNNDSRETSSQKSSHTRATFLKEDFPELNPNNKSSNTPATLQTSQAWNRNHHRHRDQDSSDEGDEKLYVRTMVFSNRKVRPTQDGNTSHMNGQRSSNREEANQQQYPNLNREQHNRDRNRDNRRTDDRSRDDRVTRGDQTQRQVNQAASQSSQREVSQKHQDSRDLREVLQERRQQQQPRSQPQTTSSTRQDIRFDQERRDNRNRDQGNRGNNNRTRQQPQSKSRNQHDQPREGQQQYSNEQANYIKELSAGVQNMIVDPASRLAKNIPQSLSNSSSARGSIDMSVPPDMTQDQHRPKRYSSQRQPSSQTREVMNPMHGQQQGMSIQPQQQYYDPTAGQVDMTGGQYYSPDEPPYAAYTPEGYPIHHTTTRYMSNVPSGVSGQQQGHHSSHGPQTGLPANMAPAGIMTPPFMPTFTPSLPPSGFPQYPPPAAYHQMAGPVTAPAMTSTGGPGVASPGSGNEIFRGGVTYYDTSQQQPLRSLLPKRAKNIIPIVPPPGSSSTANLDHHQQQGDGYSTGY